MAYFQGQAVSSREGNQQISTVVNSFCKIYHGENAVYYLQGESNKDVLNLSRMNLPSSTADLT